MTYLTHDQISCIVASTARLVYLCMFLGVYNGGEGGGRDAFSCTSPLSLHISLLALTNILSSTQPQMPT